MNAVKLIDRNMAKNLELAGDPGLMLRRRKRTREPVLYMWQGFCLFRLDRRQMRTLAKYINQVLAQEKARTRTRTRTRPKQIKRTGR